MAQVFNVGSIVSKYFLKSHVFAVFTAHFLIFFFDFLQVYLKKKKYIYICKKKKRTKQKSIVILHNSVFLASPFQECTLS